MVIAERERLGTKGGKGKKKDLQSKVKSLTKALEQQKSQIAALKRANDETSDNDDGESEAAGDAFGGRNEKKRKKTKKG